MNNERALTKGIYKMDVRGNAGTLWKDIYWPRKRCP